MRFRSAIANSTILLSEQLPPITTNIFINGATRGIKAQRDATQGDFRLIDGLVGSTTKIAGLTLKGGGGQNFVGDGGAVHTLGTLALVDCKIQENEAAKGGGVYGAGALTVEGCEIFKNKGTDGGGIHAAGSLTLQGGRIYDNRAMGNGAGIYAAAGTVVIQNTDITLNNVQLLLVLPGVGSGGGIYIGPNVVSADITNTTIGGNTVGGSGGGIYIAGGAVTVTLTGCGISGNSAGENGGGVAVDTGGTSVLRVFQDTVIRENTADEKGGGIYLGSGNLVTSYGYGITENTANVGAGLYLVTGTVWNGDPYGFIWGNFFDDVGQGAA